ncbi:hypothetical protein RRG08_049284 [Elysia crispata]|uniref:Uncharacterized protein n=1 Tax=Elysia crispata TaxID=231223 RepID=A0AAE0ZNP1_9GAST|nr:hypothetical protein RRG08_049284 [Elysia crispata]
MRSIPLAVSLHPNCTCHSLVLESGYIGDKRPTDPNSSRPNTRCRFWRVPGLVTVSQSSVGRWWSGDRALALTLGVGFGEFQAWSGYIPCRSVLVTVSQSPVGRWWLGDRALALTLDVGFGEFQAWSQSLSPPWVDGGREIELSP